MRKTLIQVFHDDARFVEYQITVNDEKVVFPVELQPEQTLTSEGRYGVKLWPGGMQPSREIELPHAALTLDPGLNEVTFASESAEPYPGDVQVLLYRMCPEASTSPAPAARVEEP